MLRYDGYSVIEAESGTDLSSSQMGLGRSSSATSKENANPIALVISDIRMPGYNGLEVLAGLRKADVAVAVILVSAARVIRRRFEEAKRLGGRTRFVHKPFELEALRSVVGANLAPIVIPFEDRSSSPQTLKCFAPRELAERITSTPPMTLGALRVSVPTNAARTSALSPRRWGGADSVADWRTILACGPPSSAHRDARGRRGQHRSALSISGRPARLGKMVRATRAPRAKGSRRPRSSSVSWRCADRRERTRPLVATPQGRPGLREARLRGDRALAQARRKVARACRHWRTGRGDEEAPQSESSFQWDAICVRTRDDVQKDDGWVAIVIGRSAS